MTAGATVSRRKTYTALATGVVAAGGLTYVGLVDPHRSGSLFPACPFRLLTGWNCPGCGGLRMTHDVLHADFGAAVVDNVFLLVGIPALLGWVLWRWHTGKPAVTAAGVVVMVVAAIAWTVIRNLPGFPLVPTVYTG